MKTFVTMGKLFAVFGLLLVAATGCQSSGGGSVHGSVYYGVGFYDPWYYGSSYYPPTVVVPPPDRPGNRPRPEHPIARPSPAPRPMPSIPSMPRPSRR